MEVASLLVDANATIDVRDNVTGKTALIKAAYVGHADVAEVLLRAGADRNAMDNQGYSALAFSTSFNHIAVLDVLLRAKADPNVQDEVRAHTARAARTARAAAATFDACPASACRAAPPPPRRRRPRTHAHTLRTHEHLRVHTLTRTHTLRS